MILIKNILNINTNKTPYELGYANCGCDSNKITLDIQVNNITDPYLEFTLVNGTIVNTSVLEVNNNIINYEVPFSYYSTNGTLNMRVRGENYNSSYIGFTISKNLTSSDNVIVKIENGKYLVKTMTPYKYHDLPIANADGRLGIVTIGDNLTIDSSGRLSSTGGGLAATVTVGTTTTGEAGTNASVTNSGTAQSAVLNFVIPRGANGIDGTNGTDGQDGTDGREVEMQVANSYIQWRYVGDTTWQNLIALSELKGAKGDTGSSGTDGKEVELQATDTYIQWKYDTDTSWTNLVPLTSLKGAKGDKGDTGAKGDKGDTGAKGDKGDTALSVTVGTTTTGKEASVTNSGTDTDLVLDFTLPRGESIKQREGSTITLDPNPNPNYNPLNIQIDGKSVQETTTGKNLLNYIDNLISSGNGLTNTLNSDGSITTSGKPTKNYATITNSYSIYNMLEDKQTYTISQEKANYNFYIQITAIKADGNTYYNSSGGKSSFTLDKSLYTNCYIGIQTQKMSDWGDSSLTMTNKFMFCKGTDNVAANGFEPYTGGQASPNPDYPQEIESVSGIENLANINDIQIGKQWSGADNVNRASIINIPVKSKTTYTLAGDISSNSHLTTLRCVQYATIGAIAQLGVVSGTFTTGSNVNYVSVEILADATITSDMVKDVKVQLEQGSIAHDYVPYGHWLTVTNTGKNLCGITSLTGYEYSYGLPTKVNTNFAITEFDSNNFSYSVASNPYLLGLTNIFKLKPNTNYTLSFTRTDTGISSGRCYIYNVSNDGTYTINQRYDGTGNLSKTFTTGDTGLIALGIGVENNSSGGFGTVNNIMIEQNSEPTEYEPYQSTSSLIDMNKSISFDKDDANILNATIDVSDKNIVSSDTVRTIYIEIEPSTTYTVERTKGSGFSFSIATSASYEIGTTVTNYNLKVDVTSLTITSGSNDKYLLAYIYNSLIDTDVTFQEVLDSIKIYGATNIKYYHKLSSIGDTKDELNIDKDGNVSIKQNIGEVVLDGNSNDWIMKSVTNGNVFQLPINNIKLLSSSTLKGTLLCNYFPTSTPDSVWSVNENGITNLNDAGYIRIRFKDNPYTTLNSFKAWLLAHPVTVQYELAEPNTVSLNKTTPLKLLEGTNNITNNDDLQPNMSIKYYTDIMGNQGINGDGILKLSSEDSSSPICLFDLDEGIYNIYGYIKYYPGYMGTTALTSPTLVTVQKSSTAAYVQIIQPYGNKIIGYEITNSSYKEKTLTTPENNYSTEEQVVGTWMGKPLYRKTLYRSKLINGTEETVNHGIQNVSAMWLNSSKSFAIWSDGFYNNLPFLHNDEHSLSIFVYSFSATSFKLKSGLDRSSLSGYITLEYTKTSD